MIISACLVLTPDLQVNGVNTFHYHLLKGLREKGVNTHLFVSNTRAAVTCMDELKNVSTFHEALGGDVRNAADNLLKIIHSLPRPLMIFPGYDFAMSAVLPTIRDENVHIIGVVHSDDPSHHLHADLMRGYWTSMVTVSKYLHSEYGGYPCEHHIPYGVEVPKGLSVEDNYHQGDHLKVLYAGRMAEEQKKISRIAEIARICCEQNLPVHFSMVGEGNARNSLEAHNQDLIERGYLEFFGPCPNRELRERMRKSHVFILTSDYEGLPLVLLEAMAEGCVPIVSDIASGVRDIIQHKENGFLCSKDQMGIYVEAIAQLVRNEGTYSKLRLNAFATIEGSVYSVNHMIERYMKLFESILQSPDVYKRKSAKIRPFRQHKPDYLPLWRLARRVKHFIKL